MMRMRRSRQAAQTGSQVQLYDANDQEKPGVGNVRHFDQPCFLPPSCKPFILILAPAHTPVSVLSPRYSCTVLSFFLLLLLSVCLFLIHEKGYISSRWPLRQPSPSRVDHGGVDAQGESSRLRGEGAARAQPVMMFLQWVKNVQAQQRRAGGRRACACAGSDLNASVSYSHATQRCSSAAGDNGVMD